MTREQQAAHERLLSILPVRHHKGPAFIDPIPRNTVGKGGRGIPKAVIVDGRKYESMTEAERKTGICRQRIYQRIKRNDGARYG